MLNQFLFRSSHIGFRLLRDKDIDLLIPLESDIEVKKYFPDGARDEHATKKMIERFKIYYLEKNLPCFMLFELHSGEFIGRSGFGLLETGETEIGYVLHKKFWGKGYATEVVTTLLQWSKNNINANYIIAYALVENQGSFRVMEKAGMQFYQEDMMKGLKCRFYRIKNH